MSAAEATPHRAKNARVFAADPDGWYVEPPDCTTALLGVERFEGGCWDPACGQGNVVRALIEAGHEAIGTDKVRRVPADTAWWDGTLDFPQAVGAAIEARRSPNIVCNPPFGRGKLVESFIGKALWLASAKVAVFTELRFLTGLSRAQGLFHKRPPHRVWILAPRPSCPPGAYLRAGGVASGGTGDFCWVVWDLTQPQPAPGSPWLTGHAIRRRAAEVRP